MDLLFNLIVEIFSCGAHLVINNVEVQNTNCVDIFLSSPGSKPPVVTGDCTSEMLKIKTEKFN